VRKPTAALGSALFFLLAPGFVAGLMPYWLTGWRYRDPAPYWLPLPFGLVLRVLGALLVLAGVALLGHAFVRFVREGTGTPAPVAPPGRVVVGGAYRYVRNPMYLALLSVIVGQALLFGQPGLLLYAVLVCVAVVGFVYGYEEPALRRRFCDSYERYRREVPAWWPRLRPWRPD
jgi:protein-S-isoprenylcysteine O-methyltransferase Ste14